MTATVETSETLAPETVSLVTRLVDGAAGPGTEDPLGEQQRRLLEHGGGPGFTALLLLDGPAPNGAQGSSLDDERLGAYGQLSAEHPSAEHPSAEHPSGEQRSSERRSFGLRIVVRPGTRGEGQRPERRLLRAAVDEVRRQGGGTVHYWVPSPSPSPSSSPSPRDLAAAAAVTAAEAEGFVPGRRLLQMRVPLPLEPGRRGDPAPVTLRPFRPGRDEEAWLAVNNRAFADHPEQGGWDRATLVAREEEPWFDPEGFLLYEEGERLAASCWTKVHRHARPPLGEIYVISVDPDHHHRGLGRALTVAGLDWLAGRGLGTGMLYVDGANQAAVSLYRSLGFDVHHDERTFVRDVV